MPDINWNLISLFANILFPLLLVFQWLWDRAKGNAVVHNLLSIRRMVGRLGHAEAPNITDSIDATLATLGARRPYYELCRKLVSDVVTRFKYQSRESISYESPFSAADVAKNEVAH